MEPQSTQDLEHRCSSLPSGGVLIARSKDFIGASDAWPWCLVIQRSATAEHLEDNHSLEEEGETLWETAIGIAHCPFCGERLDERLDERLGGLTEGADRTQAYFAHFDSSGWHAKRQWWVEHQRTRTA